MKATADFAIRGSGDPRCALVPGRRSRRALVALVATASVFAAALTAPAGAGEAGLVTIIHNDLDVPFPKPGQELYELEQLRSLFRRHPHTHIIWAHGGVGRIVRPIGDHAALLERTLAHPDLAHVSIDVSWTETAKYIVATPESIARAAQLINRYPDRFLFGTDEVAPKDRASYLHVYDMYAPLFAALTAEASEKLRKGNYERLFDEARRKVRAWEKSNLK
jgi:hypothetical protein